MLCILKRHITTVKVHVLYFKEKHNSNENGAIRKCHLTKVNNVTMWKGFS